MKTIYKAICQNIGADSFDLFTTESIDKARGAIENDIAHMTTIELKKSDHYINGYQVPDEISTNALDEYLDENGWPDPDIYEVVANEI